MKTVIMFNGPPGIGKDTLIDALGADAYMCRVSDIIKSGADEHYGLPEGTFHQWMADREMKDKKFYTDSESGVDKFLSPREMLIHYADNVVKPLEGETIFIERLADKAFAQTRYDEIILRDLGYSYEVAPFANEADKVIIIQLHHPDFNFNYDSREYVSSDLFNVKTYRIDVKRGDIPSTLSDIETTLRQEFRV